MGQPIKRVHPNKAVKVVNADSITASDSATFFFLLPLRTHFYQARRKASGKGDRCKQKCCSTFEWTASARKRKTLCNHENWSSCWSWSWRRWRSLEGLLTIRLTQFAVSPRFQVLCVCEMCSWRRFISYVFWKIAIKTIGKSLSEQLSRNENNQ